MKLDLERIHKAEDYTIGKLYINGTFFCNTLEDKVRILNSYEDKVYGQTAIPIGRYKVIISYSNHFKKEMPEILNVTFFKGIRIHAGNDKNDTNGCILVGVCKNIEEGKIYDSKNTFNKLFNILKNAFNNNEHIYINIY